MPLSLAAKRRARKRQKQLQKYIGTYNADSIHLNCSEWLKMKMQKTTLVFAASAMLLSATQLSAQDNVRKACMPDIRKYCSAEMSTFSREKVRVCLMKNIQKTVPACQDAAKAMGAAESAKKKGS
jgi:hypothetical protein